MLRYLARRVVGFVSVLLMMSFIVFCLQSIIPADPARAMAGPMAPAATLDTIRHELGLDDPVVVQYGRFLLRLVQGDLGTSVRTRQPVIDDVMRYAMGTIELIIAAMFLVSWEMLASARQRLKHRRMQLEEAERHAAGSSMQAAAALPRLPGHCRGREAP